MFYKVFSLKRVLSSIIIIAVFALSSGMAAQMLSAAVNGTVRLLPIYSVKTDEKKVAITFDAAWGNSDTNELIEILAEFDAKATFFIVGDWAERFPADVKAFYDAGHEISNHSNTHAAFSSLSIEKIKEEIQLCNETLKRITGVAPKNIRFPSGDYDNKSISTAKDMGLFVIQWSADSLDYKGLSPEKITERILNNTKEGSIILFHNDVKNTPLALRTILAALKMQGYSFVTVDELIIKDNYRIDHMGCQIKNSPDDN